MKKLLFSFFIAFVVFAIIPMNSVFAQEIKPVEGDTKETPKGKSYDLKLEYIKGMVFERMLKIELKGETSDEAEEDFESKVIFKTDVTILDVKDAMPTHVKVLFKDFKFEGNLPDGDNPTDEEIKKIPGSWLEFKKNAEGKFELKSKSENFPEIENKMLDDMEDSTLLLFDMFDLPKKPVAVGESFKFDFKSMMIDDDMSQGIDQMTGATGEKKDFMLKLEKVSEKDGIKIAHLKGEVEQDVEFFGMKIALKITITIDLDITNNRCLKCDFDMGFDMSGSDPESGEEMKVVFTMKMLISNTFTKTETKTEVTPKDDE